MSQVSPGVSGTEWRIPEKVQADVATEQGRCLVGNCLCFRNFWEQEGMNVWNESEQVVPERGAGIASLKKNSPTPMGWVRWQQQNNPTLKGDDWSGSEWGGCQAERGSTEHQLMACLLPRPCFQPSATALRSERQTGEGEGGTSILTTGPLAWWQTQAMLLWPQCLQMEGNLFFTLKKLEYNCFTMLLVSVVQWSQVSHMIAYPPSLLGLPTSPF